MQNKSYPLTREQQGLWIEWKISSEGLSYNTCVQLKLQGKLDVERFCEAAANVVDFFELLRSYCTPLDDRVLLSFSNQPYHLETIDLYSETSDRTTDEDNSESAQLYQRALAILKQKRQVALDLTRFPLISAALIRTAPETYYFTGVVPHLISDGASAIYFLMAFSTAYNRGKQGLLEEFSEKSKNWGDYLCRRQEIESTFDRQAALNYWRHNLSGAMHHVDLSHPTETPDDASGKREHFLLSAELSTGLKQLAKTHHTTLFSVMAALFSTFLYRYSSQQDLMIGYPVDLRPRGFRNAFGFFVNILPLRIRLDADLSFSELVAKIHQQRKRDRKYQSLPSLDIVKAHRQDTPDFDGRMFNVSMAETVSRLQNLFLDEITSEPLDHDQIEIRDDLALIYENGDQGIGIWLEFREVLFDEIARARMLRQMERLIHSVMEEPSQSIAAIDLSGSTERKLMLETWNRTQESERPLQLHQFFEQQARSHPEAIALQMNSQRMTYQELNTRADQLAAHLQHQYHVSGRKVAILLQRSPRQITCMLALLKAGAAYLPLDPEWPATRVNLILKDASTCLLISESQCNLNNPPIPLYLLDDSLNPIVNATPVARPRDPHLAYVIYTSGSSGTPKGTVVSHNAAALRIGWLSRHLPLSGADRVLQNTNYTFDVSVAEIFWPLACGARLILVPAAQHRDARYLASLIAAERITATCIVPSALAVLLRQIQQPSQLGSLRHVAVAGEALTPSIVKQFFSLSEARLYNFYGPTEAAIYTTWRECQQQDDFIPIGRPLGNTTCYVLDENLQPVPLGAQGQLFIGGDGLAEGYLGHATATQAQFITNPFGRGKLYCTGDLVRYLDNGELDFIGRHDTQIKLRGYRIEMGEICNRLLEIDEVADAVVVLRHVPGTRPEPRLCAYYSTSETASCNAASQEKHAVNLQASALRRHLALSLPDYMIPAHFVELQRLPRLSSDKVDIKRLPPVQIQTQSENLIPPQTAKERILAAIFAEVLRVPLKNIGVNSNFFELGGDSMMIIELACAAEEQQIYIEVHELFVHRTIADILRHARKTPNQTFDQGEVSGEFPALPRHTKLFRDGFVKPGHWNRHMLLQFDTALPLELLQQALDALVVHHDGLRLSFLSESRVLNQPNPLPVTVRSQDVSQLSERQRNRCICNTLNEAHASLDLNRPPLFRAWHFKTSANSCQLALVMHHLLIDMYSSRILLEDLLLACQQLRAGNDIQLPPKTSSVKTWAERINIYARHHDLECESSYWCNQLRPPEKPLAGDKETCPTPALEVNQAKQRLFLSRTSTDALTTQVKNQLQVEIHQLVLWCLADTFHDWSGLDALVFNTCGHGRDKVFDDISLMRTVGELNTVFPMRLKLPLADGLQSIITAYQNIPARGRHYGMLRYRLQQPAITALPEPQIFFNYVSRIDTELPEGVAQLLPVKLIEPPLGVNTTAPENKACYTLYLEAGIIDDQLFISASYDKRQFSNTRVQALTHALVDRLEALCADSTAVDRMQYGSSAV